MGLLDPNTLGLLGPLMEQPKAQGLLSGELQQLLGGGLLSRFQPGPNEGWSEKLFGTNDPRDPRGPAMMALSLGLMRGGKNGGFADGLEAYNKTYAQHEDRMTNRALNNLLLGKSALEIQGMLNGAKRDQSIQSGLRKLQDEEQTQRGRAATIPMLNRSPVDEFGTAGIGDVPMYSMGGLSQSGATTQSPQQGGTRGELPLTGAALTVGSTNTNQPGQMGSSRGNYTQGLSNRFMKQAEVYATNGDFGTANKLYEQAAKWMPEVHKIEVAMQNSQPVNVITMKDGTQVVSNFAPTPKVHWADTGGAVLPVNEYTMQPLASIKKTMTPGETASNQVAWANNRNSVDRLSWDKSQANKPQFHEGNWHVPPSSDNPQGAVVAPQMPPGTMPKLTEVQANATQFATRMRDASGVIGGFEKNGAPWASTVARAGYDPQFPNWIPGGQVASGAARGLNNATVPEDAQKYYQAQTNWVSANLRKESGAAIGKDEMAQEIRKWFPQPGDGAEVIAQKTAARKVAEEGMLVQAGPGAKQVSSILERAGSGAGGKGAQAQALDLPNGMNVKELKHGAAYRLPGGRVGVYDSLTRRFTEQ
ncbi:MAG: hypothetical protein V4864_16080 [Pseudomonadota bacterium]